jgi:hypothetical protein
MSKRGIFYKIINSVHNVDEIISFSKEGLSRAILYALLLCTFLGASKGLIYCFKANTYINVIIDSLRNEKYEFTIKDGQLNMESSPIKADSDEIFIYIDENTKLDEYNKLNSIYMNEDQYILFLKEGVVVNSTNLSNSLPPTKILYKNIGMENVNNDIAIEAVKNSKMLIFPILCIVNAIYCTVNYLVDALIIALLSLLNVFILRLNISFANVFSLVIYAATLPNILVLFLTMVSPYTDFSTAAVLGTLLFTYLIFYNIRKDSNKV